MSSFAKKLRHYTMVEEIGRGGSGVVYRAQHQKTGHQVAIKLLHPDLTADPEQVARFYREARIHQQIRHPNTLQFIGLYESEKTLAIVMELLKGCSLKRYAQHHGALSTGELITVMDALVQGLAVAHAKRITHRDIKPSNIFLCNDGTLKIMDFGLAKSLQNNDDITKTNMHPVGSYYYMAPEQIMGQDTDARTDLYALGITLFELATGQLPFDAKAGGAFEIMAKQVRHRPPDLESINPNVDPKIAIMILKLLEKEPQKRFQNCSELMGCLPDLGVKQALSLQGSENIYQFSDLSQHSGTISPHVTGIFQTEQLKPEENIPSETLLWLFHHDSSLANSPPPLDLTSPQPMPRNTLEYLRKHIATLPQLPNIWHQMQIIMQQADASAFDLAKCVEQDRVLTAHVLKACNSPVYKAPGSPPITRVALALTRLGMDVSQQIILQEVMPKFGHLKRKNEVQALHFHAQCIAALSRILASYSHVIERHTVTLLAMLHDIGKLVMLHIESDDKLDALKQRIQQGESNLKAESDIMGYTHIDAGMMLALHWKLPRSIHRFIYFHHHPCWHPMDTWGKDIQPAIMLIHTAHILLAGVTPKMKTQTIWQESKRSHVLESQGMLQSPLHLPLKDVNFFHQMQQEVLQVAQPYAHLFEGETRA